MLHRTDLQHFHITGKWHLEEEYELKLISKLWACDRMVAMSIVTEKEGCLEIMARTPQMESKQS